MTTAPAHPRRPFVSCVIVAAGSGQRIGAGKNKVLLEFAGQPLLAHTLSHLAASGACDEFVLVVTSADEDAIGTLARRIPELPPIRFARGGAERADSVRAGVAASNASAAVILIHDAARPFVSPSLVERLIERALADGAAIPTLPLVDTIKRVRDQRIQETLDRQTLHAAQTPQAFRAELLRDALARTSPQHTPTDDASLLETLGIAVTALPGDPLNLKITTPHDLTLAPALLAAYRATIATRTATESAP